MCGIAGIFRFDGIAGLDSRAIHKMTEVLRHRGPDDDGVFLGKDKFSKIAMGSRRLSIIDLSQAGHQPMPDESGNYSIVYNGEIYNFKELKKLLLGRGWRFKSETDTEVLLYLYIDYGASCLSMIEGMFAFAIWSEKDQELFFARDRVGKKPFFYFIDENKFIFGSEIKSILAHPEMAPQFNESALFTYLNLRYVPAPDTFFKYIYKLPPASYGIMKDKKLIIRTFWDIQPENRRDCYAWDQGCDSEFIRLLNQSVKKRLIADVPFGVFLSGGIDSSSVVSVMHEILGDGIRTYSVGFDSFPDELRYADMVARAFNTSHNEFLITHKDFTDNIEKITYCRDLPVSEPADIPIYIMSKFASRDIKVALTGEGSDEILGGYYKYLIEPYSKYFRAMPSIFKKGLYLFAGKAPFAFKSISSYVNIAGIENDTVRFFTWFSSLSQKKICGILNREFVDTLRLPADLDKTSKLLGYKGFEANEYLDFKYWLPDNLLERADRLTMANSLEMRAPFLDHDFVEFCFSLPGKEKIKGFLTKVILRRAMKKRLPKPVLERTKVGFSTPFKYWIRNELREWAADMLFSGKLKKSGVFNQAALRGIFEEHVSGAADNSKIIWTMVNFEIWYNRYFTERDRA